MDTLNSDSKSEYSIDPRSSDNFRKKHKFAHLGGHAFWKASMLYFKIL